MNIVVYLDTRVLSSAKDFLLWAQGIAKRVRRLPTAPKTATITQLKKSWYDASWSLKDIFTAILRWSLTLALLDILQFSHPTPGGFSVVGETETRVWGWFSVVGEAETRVLVDFQSWARPSRGSEVDFQSGARPRRGSWWIFSRGRDRDEGLHLSRWRGRGRGAKNCHLDVEGLEIRDPSAPRLEDWVQEIIPFPVLMIPFNVSNHFLGILEI